MKNEKDFISSHIGNVLPDYYGDERLLPYISYNKNGLSKCIYCGEKADTREHIPSRIFLDDPHSGELAIIPSCFKCNNSYSDDEQYLACLIEWMYAKHHNLPEVRREKIRKTFDKRPFLRNQFEEVSEIEQKGNKNINLETDRIEKIIIKLARGHMAYSLSEIFDMDESPTHVNFAFYPQLSEEVIHSFNSNRPTNILPEIGSRNFRQVIVDNANSFWDVWKVVATDRYRFLTYIDSRINVRIVIGEFFYAEVIW